MTIVPSLLVCLLGLVIYFITGNPGTPPPGTINAKFNVIGLHMFWVGLLAFLITWPGSKEAVNLLRG